MYRCQTQSVLKWKIGNLQPILFAAIDSGCRRFDDEDGRFFAFLQNNPAIDNYLLSYLVIPYIPEWNGTVVQCMNGPNSRPKNLSYIVTGK
jgi:hypothetical protein